MFWQAILIIIILVLIFTRNNKPSSQDVASIVANNKQWVDYLLAYHQLAKTAAEKTLIAKMLIDLQRQNMPVTDEQIAYLNTAPSDDTSVIAPTAQVSVEAFNSQPSLSQVPASKHTEVQLDNTSLLLYFGAFLFVASAGLFVTLGGASGVLRAFIVLFVMLGMYGGGVWLYRNKPHLKQAGLAFAGIGIVLAPLVGAAWYNFVFGHNGGEFVWFATSLLCFGLYVHALQVFHNTLMSYVLIFTFLSLFESGVGIMQAPLYYFGWGIAIVGIGLLLLSSRTGKWAELRESSQVSARLFLPVSVLVSLVLVGQHGSAQLGVSLLFAAVFYALEFKQSADGQRVGNALVSQVSALIGVACLTYGVTNNWRQTAVTLTVLGIVQAIVIFMYGHQSQLWRNFGSVTLITSAVAITASIVSENYLFAAMLSAVAVSAVVWFMQKRGDAYTYGALVWIGLPYVYGQWVITAPHISSSAQVIISSLSVFALWGAMLMRQPAISNWKAYAGSTYLVGAAALLFYAAIVDPLLAVIVSMAITVGLIGIAELRRQPVWAEIATIVIIAGAVQASANASAFLLAILFALSYGVLASLRYRRETLRWFGTAAWLVLPYGLARVSAGVDWTATMYAWAYIVVMFGLLFSRGIARGVWFTSSKVPVLSFARSASVSYVVGYTSAATIALAASLFTSNSQLYSSLIIGVLMLTVIVVARKIEKRNDVLALLPLLAQGLLMSLVRPGNNNQILDVLTLLSSALAVATYVAATYLAQYFDGKLEEVRQSALIMTFLAPAAVLFTGHNSWTMALGLLVTGLVSLHYVRAMSQNVRELAGVICTLSIAWGMQLLGIHALQAYTHLVVANLGLYAYLRMKAGDAKQTDNYLWIMMGVATIPLALQALGDGGSIYGIWLLLEQVAIMLLGMALNKKFVTRWGLYTAVGAVLYQLRGLGYAALAVLAMFLIGLAVYQLQKHDGNKPN